MNTNAKVLAGCGIIFFLWAFLTGAQIAWRLTFVCLVLVFLRYIVLCYWSVNLSCSVELRVQGGKNEGCFDITYVFANNGMIPIPLCMVSVHLDKEMGSLLFEAEAVSFSIGEIKTIRRSVQCLKRGIYCVGGATVTLWDPLGIGTLNKSFDKKVTVEIFPHKYPVKSFLTSGCEEGGGVRGNWNAEQDYTSIRRIREALPQESARHVHWKASARTEELQICEYETRKRRGITILLDSNAVKYSDDSDRKVEDRCVEVAAGLIYHWLEKGYAVYAIIEEGALLELSGMESAEAALRALTVFRPKEGDSLAHALKTLRIRRRESSVLQIITPGISEDEAGYLSGENSTMLFLFLVGAQKRATSENLQIVQIPV